MYIDFFHSFLSKERRKINPNTKCRGSIIEKGYILFFGFLNSLVLSLSFRHLGGLKGEREAIEDKTDGGVYNLFVLDDCICLSKRVPLVTFFECPFSRYNSVSFAFWRSAESKRRAQRKEKGYIRGEGGLLGGFFFFLSFFSLSVFSLSSDFGKREKGAASFSYNAIGKAL